MSARVVADALVLVHLLFIAFVVLGGLLVARWGRLAWLHLPTVAWGAWIEFSSSVCPLTPLENHFRQLAGEQGYAGSFIDRYLIPLIYPPGLTSSAQWTLGLAVLVVNAAVYASLVAARARGHRQRRRSGST